MKRIQTKITLTYLILAVVIIAAVGIISSLEIESLFEEPAGPSTRTSSRRRTSFLMNGEFSSERPRAVSIQHLADVLGVRVTLVAADGTVVADSDVPFERLSTLEIIYSARKFRMRCRNRLGRISAAAQRWEETFSMSQNNTVILSRRPLCTTSGLSASALIWKI